MSLECLLLSPDPEVASVLQPALEKLSISVKLVTESGSGRLNLLSEKYDGVVVDCDDLEGGVDVLRELRHGTSNRSSVTFAIVNGGTKTTQAFEMGANFVLQKPIQPVNAVRCFTAAFGLMLREKRRYFRVPVDMPVIITFNQGEHVKATATNLSEGGMAVQFSGAPPDGAITKVHFTLPGTHTSLEPKAGLAWANGSGMAGIRFLGIPQISREPLERWLCSQIKETQPSKISEE